MNDKDLYNIYTEAEKEQMLWEFNFPKKDVESKISAASFTIVDHLVKILMFGLDCSCYSHWFNEIDTRFLNITKIRLKPNGKIVKYDDLVKWSMNWLSEHTYLNVLNSMKRLEKSFNPINYEKLKTRYNEFIVFYKSLLKSCSEQQYTEEVLQSSIESFLTRI